MKKHILTLLALVLIVQIGFAGSVEPTTVLTNYYQAADGKASNNSDDLRKALCTIISANYTSIGYSSLQDNMYAASSDPTDFVNGNDMTMEDIYSSKPYKSSDNGSSANDCGKGWNKEHTVPQSWFNEKSPMKSDAFHVYPTDIRMNSLRSSYPYGENEASKGCSNYGYGSVGPSTFPGYEGTVFDPGEGGENGSYKGDLARTYFYMATRYRDVNFTGGTGNICFTYSNNVANLTTYMVNLMLKWHREDPVSEKELKRNNAIYAHQKNRNPFIDYPELVEYIWGKKKGETVNITELISGYDGGSSSEDPENPGVTYNITWFANGDEVQTDEVKEYGKVTALPDEPQSCSTESNVFMGWTDIPILGTQDEAPVSLYTNVADIPAVTEDINLYAVFAKQTTSGASAATYTYDADHLAGWENTASAKGSYWLLSQGKTLISPEIDLSGLSSIVVNMRTYGGTQYDKLDIRAGSTTITTMQATKGSTMTEYTWTNNLTLSGTSALVFSAPQSVSDKGIGFSSVVINATGEGISYSRYITSCQGTTEVLAMPVKELARKVLIGNQLYIFIGEQLFTITGQTVK